MGSNPTLSRCRRLSSEQDDYRDTPGSARLDVCRAHRRDHLVRAANADPQTQRRVALTQCTARRGDLAPSGAPLQCSHPWHESQPRSTMQNRTVAIWFLQMIIVPEEPVAKREKM